MKTITSIFLLLSFCAFAQTNPCSTVEHNQFDFWLGEWEVFNSSGTNVGENTIKLFGQKTKMEKQFVLFFWERIK